MKLAEVMLEVARTITDVYDGLATSGSTTYLVDTMNRYPADHWAGGTAWVTSGSTITCEAVKTHTENKLTFENAIPAVSANDPYSVCQGHYFPKHSLAQAINLALSEVRVTAADTTLTTVSAQETYTLPIGVNDVRRVEIAQSLTAPYDYKVHYQWATTGNTLFFGANVPSQTGYKIRIWYACRHPQVDATDEIDGGVNYEWLKWSGVVNALRRSIEIIKKDNPTLLDLLNEAKQKEGLHMMSKSNLIPRDPRHNSWSS